MIHTLSHNIFIPLNEYQRELDRYNKQVEVFDQNEGENAFKITQEQFMNYLASNTEKKTNSASQYEKDYQELITPVEQYLKTMALCNRTAKLGLAFIDHDITDTMNLFETRNKVTFSEEEKSKLEKDLKKVCETIYHEYNIGKVGNLKDLQECYNQYYQKKISKYRLIKSKEYQTAFKVIKSKTMDLPNDILTPDLLSRYFSYKGLVEKSYLIKSKMRNTSLKCWLNTIKKIREDENLNQREKEQQMTKLKGYFRITQFKDRKAKNKYYDTCLSFAYQGYNAPFTVHTDRYELQEMLSKYDIEIEKGKFDDKSFNDLENDMKKIEVTSSFRLKPILPYKYTKHQLEKIEEYYSGLDSFSQNYEAKRYLLENTKTMIGDLNRLSGPNHSYYFKADQKEEDPCI